MRVVIISLDFRPYKLQVYYNKLLARVSILSYFQQFGICKFIILLITSTMYVFLYFLEGQGVEDEVRIILLYK